MSIERARSLRKSATPPEQAMWRLLYPLRQAGHNFRRQVPLGRYYADFADHGSKLVIELDGDTHGTEAAIAYDALRGKFMDAEGYRVLRFTNTEVMGNPEGVYVVIAAALEQAPALVAPPTPDPSPRGGGRRLDSAQSEDRKNS
ncbi:endonuclease domain-containing protein [Devosia sp.]|uniref:endonuclease domain-containing protein n=1 Tax=Devosia sp. TaxID=1871048 RepID=UPI0032665595